MSSSAITKNTFAASLKHLVLVKPYDKISISDITNDCRMNRQSFYYHFQDKNELLSWIMYNDLFVYITHGVRFHNWYGKLEGFLKRMENEREFYSRVLESGDGIFHDYLYDVMHVMFTYFFDNAVSKEGGTNISTEFFADFYSHGFCGVIIDWAIGGMKSTPHEVIQSMKDLALENIRIGEGFKEYL